MLEAVTWGLKAVASRFNMPLVGILSAAIAYKILNKVLKTFYRKNRITKKKYRLRDCLTFESVLWGREVANDPFRPI